MSNTIGSFVWYELVTTDADAAQAFYADLVGWSAAPSGMPGIDYRILHAPDGEAIGGLMAQVPGISGPPAWYGYVKVDDVDAGVAAVEAAGGAVHMPAMTLDGVGRMALVADPQGATFYLFAPADGAPATAFQPGEDAAAGHVVWNELTAPDQDAALAFYAPLLGWRHEGSLPMGDLGDYRFLHGGGVCLGATMTTPPGGDPGWQAYFLVADIDAAVDRLHAGGGTLIQGPDEIPGGAYSVAARDPQGARFGLVGNRVAKAAA